MKILITGSNGFLGHNVQNELPKIIPSVEISKLVRLKSRAVGEYGIDFNNLDTLLQCPAVQNAEVVIHIAGVTKGIAQNDFRNGNVVPTKNLLEALRRTNPKLQRFIYISSQTVAGPSGSLEHLKTEEEDPMPVEFYGKSKLEAENIVRSYGCTIPYTILRPASVYGPYDADFLNIFKMTRFGLNIYPGYKHNYTSYVYAPDVVRAVAKAILTEKAQNQTYFICNERPASWQEIQELIFKIAGTRALSFNIPVVLLKGLSYLSIVPSFLFHTTPILNPQKMILSVQKYWIASGEKAKRELDFTPSCTLEQGMRSTYDWYKQKKMI
jgi:nucleoside-diphosphate-sugar epimerase